MQDERFSSYRLSEFLGVSERTVQGWFSNRPIPFWVTRFIQVYKDKSFSESGRRSYDRDFYITVTARAEKKINYFLSESNCNSESTRNLNLFRAAGVYQFWYSLVCNSDFFSMFDDNRFKLMLDMDI